MAAGCLLCGWRRRRRLDYSGRMERNEIVWVEPYATSVVGACACAVLAHVVCALISHFVSYRASCNYAYLLTHARSPISSSLAPVRHIYGESCILYGRPIYTPPTPKDTHLDIGGWWCKIGYYECIYKHTQTYISSVYLRIQNPWRSVARPISLNFPLHPNHFPAGLFWLFRYFPGFFFV